MAPRGPFRTCLRPTARGEGTERVQPRGALLLSHPIGSYTEFRWPNDPGLKVVYIAHPLRGAWVENIKRAKEYVAAAIDAGLVPLAPYLMFEGILDEDVPGDREQGLELDKAVISRCDELWLCGEVMSAGMKLEAEHAISRGIPCVSAVITTHQSQAPDEPSIGRLSLTALEPIMVRAIEVGSKW